MYRLSKKEREFREKMRGKYPAEAKWYAMMAHCGREHQVRDQILLDFADDGVEEVFLPELKTKANGGRTNGRRKPPELLFPSYVFLRCRMSDVTYVTVSNYSSVFSILGRAYRIPRVVDDTEMSHLKGALVSYPAPMLSPRLNIGAEAVITQGLMEGLRGRIVEFNSHYVKLETSFSFFDDGTSIIVVVPQSDLKLEETGMFSLSRRVLGYGNAKCQE